MGGAGDSNTAHTYRGTKKGLLVVPGNEDVTLIHLHEIIGVNFHWPLFGIHLSAILDLSQSVLNYLYHCTWLLFHQFIQSV